MKSLLLFGTLLFTAIPSYSHPCSRQEVKPIERTQSGCPASYHIVMDECRPLDGARPAKQQKDGRCKPGWAQSMGYCLKYETF